MLQYKADDVMSSKPIFSSAMALSTLSLPLTGPGGPPQNVRRERLELVGGGRNSRCECGGWDLYVSEAPQ